ncbi:DUF3006 domain-containing protein [Deinococcus arenicola]|uniref:DUF3006 domain-containing protein n=1 Tax=Deinococcus arenicola TaxID=2994950 RepID=A0ABU4DVZ1_9DEIO|nr:DUF3006 domain-containing protein [Deinococcus sp. ZS9-10]MDV6375829.1 DUF3006 domain-containing protein [Deinococcus sp. ZS9-10]
MKKVEMKKAAHPLELDSQNPAGTLPAQLQPEQPQPESQQERWTVDGIEDSPHGPLARLEREDGSTFDLPLRMLPGGLREGDLLAVHDGPDGATARILVGETMTRHEAMQTTLDAENGEITV